MRLYINRMLRLLMCNFTPENTTHPVKKSLFLILFCLSIAFAGKAQKIDTIYFNLYTDSLKKGSLHFNYINVEGKFKDGSIYPLDSSQLKFSSSVGKWKGNVLMLDSATKEDFVTVTVHLIENPSIKTSTKIYIKKKEFEQALKTEEELLDDWNKKPKKKN